MPVRRSAIREPARDDLELLDQALLFQACLNGPILALGISLLPGSITMGQPV